MLLSKYCEFGEMRLPDNLHRIFASVPKSICSLRNHPRFFHKEETPTRPATTPIASCRTPPIPVGTAPLTELGVDVASDVLVGVSISVSVSVSVFVLTNEKVAGVEVVAYPEFVTVPVENEKFMPVGVLAEVDGGEVLSR